MTKDRDGSASADPDFSTIGTSVIAGNQHGRAPVPLAMLFPRARPQIGGPSHFPCFFPPARKVFPDVRQ